MKGPFEITGSALDGALLFALIVALVVLVSPFWAAWWAWEKVGAAVGRP